MSTELTFKEVAEHNSKKDLYVVVHDKVYNATTFLDEHPGGEEVLLDVGGQDATEAFEDVGHSDEAREILAGLLVGPLKREAHDPAPAAMTTQNPSSSGTASGAGMGVGLYAVVLVGVLAAFGVYRYMQAQSEK
ncbi:MAG: cytochrome b5 [Lasallia pustulata]|uniref:Cytochrome b5 n=1 Tax=Lasallia pustulata TaxID=136370 RepID=A0A5M8PVB1_9LECA|nr:MAG: cytochrome b5 [Lasallia pustulata]